MFVRDIPQQFRISNCDVQIFYGNNVANDWRIWDKPTGVSHVYILSIGAGGNGNGGQGGGSGGTYVWYGAARNVPDALQIVMGVGGTNSNNIYYRFPESGVSFLAPGTPSFVGPAGAGDPSAFTASGFRNSRVGQAGDTIGASSETFLSAGVNNSTQTGNYGYVNPSNNSRGYFLLQPIIVAVGATGTGNGVYGCGGGPSGTGGAGLVLIASW
jgi:hypothetical protein